MERHPIIVVEDDPDQLALMMLLLSDGGYAPVEASSGADLFALLQQHRPVAIVLDLGLPDARGVEVCRRLRTLSTYRHLPIIAVTGWSQGDAVAGLQDAPFNEVFQKPIDPQQLLDALKRWMVPPASSALGWQPPGAGV